MGRRQRRTGSYAIYLLPGVLLCIPVILVPVVANIGLSFTHWQGIGRPHWAGTANYTRLFHDEQFWARCKEHLSDEILADLALSCALWIGMGRVLRTLDIGQACKITV